MANTVGARMEISGEKAFNDSLKAVNAQIKALGAELDSVTAQFAKNEDSEEALAAKNTLLGKSTEATVAKVSLLREEISSQQKYLDALGKTLDDVTEAFGKDSKEALQAQNAYNQQAKKVNDLKTQLNKAEGSLARMEHAVESNTKALEGMGEGSEAAAEGIDQLAAALVAAGVAKGVQEVAETLWDCVDAYSGFESQMSTVGAISGATGDELEDLAAKAREMGAATAFTATEAAEAFEYMSMAGWKSEDMLDGLEGVMHLAAASGEDLASVSDIVTDALTAFGLKAADSAHFADVLAAASSNSNTKVGMMGETFKYVAPVAGALGYSIEDAAVAIGLMANSSIKGSSAGTALRSILTRLSKPTAEVAKYMELLGISMTDTATGAMLPLSDVIDQLRAGFARLEQTQYAEYAAGIAGQEAMSGLLAIVNAGTADYDKLSAAIDNASGAAERMSEVKLDNLAGQMTLLESAADGLKLAIGEQLAPALRNLAELGTDAFTWAAEFVEDNPWVVDAVVGLTTALGALALGVAGLAAAPKIIEALHTALNLLAAHPLFALTAAAVGLAAAIGSFTSRSLEGTSAQRALAKSMKESQKAYEDLQESMEEERASTEATIRSLLDLLAVENKSAAQKEVIAQMVAELNEAIPNLGLAYDSMGDSINLSADALERLAADQAAQETYTAQVGRLNDLYKQRSDLTREVEAAEADLEDARAAGQYVNLYYEAALRALNSVLEDNQEEIDALEASTSEYERTLAASAAGTEDMAGSVEDLSGEMDALAEAYQTAYSEAYDSISRQVGLFQDLEDSANASIDDLIESLARQAEYMNSYRYLLQCAKSRL